MWAPSPALFFHEEERRLYRTWILTGGSRWSPILLPHPNINTPQSTHAHTHWTASLMHTHTPHPHPTPFNQTLMTFKLTLAGLSMLSFSKLCITNTENLPSGPDSLTHWGSMSENYLIKWTWFLSIYGILFSCLGWISPAFRHKQKSRQGLLAVHNCGIIINIEHKNWQKRDVLKNEYNVFIPEI